MKIKILISISLLICQIGCGFYDYERAENEKILGNFYVINLNLKEHRGFYLGFEERNGHIRHFIEDNEQIDILKADQRLILIKTMSPRVSYYLIQHHNGDSVLSNRKLYDIEEFKEFEIKLKSPIIFIAPRDE